MASKYDTNPLDPEFPEKVKAAQNQAETSELPFTGSETRHFSGQTADVEDQTRRFAPGYQPYAAPYTPGSYQPIGFHQDQSITRKVEKIGLPENIMTALPYIPWYFGMVAGLLMLLFMPKTENKVRFHAAQGLSAHIAIMIVTAILGGLGRITGMAEVGNFIFILVTTVMLFIFAYKAYKGRPVHIEAIDDLTNWLEEKIGPVKT